MTRDRPIGDPVREPALTDAGEFAREKIAPQRELPHPDRIGPYRIVEVLGQGGMGTVYLAEQSEPIRRLVAIKLIRSSRRDTGFTHRFEAERRALARMSHPNIAQVYEAGDTDDGHPYFVMEHVPGLPITEHCDRHRLAVDERLALFVAVCRGIHHAHQKGVLHRDIKPANILVAVEQGHPVAKIIDFGVAKMLDADRAETPETMLGSVVGTPEYLSPESLASSRPGETGDPDTRSDVYALGVLLFELLAGERPFGKRGESAFEILRQVSEGEVPAPSARLRALDHGKLCELAEGRATTPRLLRRKLRGDLDWITLRSTARERERRYDSAAELAADIERHLHFRPVLAGPPGFLYSLGKLVRRHRVAVAAAIAVFLALALGIAARTLEARRAQRAAAAALQAQGETQQVIDFLVDLFRVNEPGSTRGETVTARELLDRGAVEIRSRLGDQPETRARLLETIGMVYRALELPEPAEPLLREALALREKTGRSNDPSDPSDPELAAALDRLGEVLWLRGKYPESERLLRRAFALREARFGPESLEVAEVLDHLGSVYDVQARYGEAQPIFERALAIREKALGPDALPVAASLDDLGVLHLDAGHPELAEPLLARALAIREARLGPDDAEVAVSANGLAIALYSLHRLDESRAMHERALAIRQKVFGPESAAVAQSLNNLANIDLDLHRLDDAEKALRRAEAIWIRLLGPDHARVGIVKFNLGDAFLDRGDARAAEPYLRRAVEIFRTAYGPDHPHVALASKRLADALAALGRPGEAAAACAQAIAVRQRSAGPDAPETKTLRGECAALTARGAGRR